MIFLTIYKDGRQVSPKRFTMPIYFHNPPAIRLSDMDQAAFEFQLDLIRWNPLDDPNSAWSRAFRIYGPAKVAADDIPDGIFNRPVRPEEKEGIESGWTCLEAALWPKAKLFTEEPEEMKNKFSKSERIGILETKMDILRDNLKDMRDHYAELAKRFEDYIAKHGPRHPNEVKVQLMTHLQGPFDQRIGGTVPGFFDGSSCVVLLHDAVVGWRYFDDVVEGRFRRVPADKLTSLRWYKKIS